MLEVTDIEAGYGEARILRGISFDLSAGDILSVIGPNGAGKTTLMRALMNIIPAQSGTVSLDGEDITDLPTHARVERGLTLVSEERNLFRDLTVQENLKLGSYTARGPERETRRQRVYELFPRLAERKSQRAGTLSGGEAQMLALGRSLMTDLQVLLLDEPSLGLAPKLVPELFDKIVDINEEGVSIVLVEQRAQEALGIADTGLLLENGAIVYRDDAASMLDDQTVVDRYMGGS